MKKLLIFLFLLIPVLLTGVNEYYYEPWIASTTPIRQGIPLLVRNDKGEMIAVNDSLKIVNQKAEWSVLVIMTNNEKPDTIEIELKNLLLWEKTTDVKNPIELPDSVVIYMLRKVKLKALK